MNEISAVGIDLAKNVFELCGQNRAGRVVFRRRCRRSKLLRELVNLPPCTVGIEACGGAHHWAREISALGHTVRILPPRYVKPYVKGNKTDRNDAEAICEAATRGHVPLVAIKTPEQQALQTFHRHRALLVRQRTAQYHALRAALSEFGRVTSRGQAALRALVKDALADDTLPGLLRESLQGLWSVLLGLESQIATLDRRLEQLARSHPVARALMDVPGIGPKTATALPAAIGDFHVFGNGRALAAFLGLVPRQHASGDRSRLGRISKRGDSYLRGLLIHGARSALHAKSQRTDPQLVWARRVAERHGTNKGVVALASKNARIVWAMITTGEAYRHAH